MKVIENVRYAADCVEERAMLAKRFIARHGTASCLILTAALLCAVSGPVMYASRAPDLSRRTTTSSLRSFEGSPHPFVIPVASASAKRFGSPGDADATVRQPCEPLSAAEAAENLYEPRGGSGAKYIVSNLFDVGRALITGKENAIALPKLYNISGVSCDAHAAGGAPQGHAHGPPPAPNPCILTMLGDTGEFLYAVNPTFRPSGKGARATVLVADDTFPGAEPKWVKYYDRVVFAFKDWQTMMRVEEEVWGVKAYSLQASLHLLLHGTTIYDAGVKPEPRLQGDEKDAL